MSVEIAYGAEIAALKRRVDQLEHAVAPAGLAGLETPARRRFRAVLAAVAAEFGVPAEVLTGPLREGWMIRARFTAQWLLREGSDYSYPRIGRMFERDHTSVLSAVRRVAQWRAAEPEYRAATDRLLAEVRAAAFAPLVVR